ncbi:MAG: hypothetical protein PHQ60_16485 [Sideroxydans sp.]|nr:hypothetical protein [Sideroxydans sp.]
MNTKKKYVLVELDETEAVADRLSAAGLKGVMLGFESDEISAELFEAAPALREALSYLHSFCNSTSVYMSVPEAILEKADAALARAKRK